MALLKMTISKISNHIQKSLKIFIYECWHVNQSINRKVKLKSTKAVICSFVDNGVSEF